MHMSAWFTQSARCTPQTTVCIPAHNEAATIADVVALVQRACVQHPGLVAEVIVVDDRSTDATAAIARQAGARVLSTVDECASFGGARGKGDAIWTALRRCTTEFITFVDADITELDDHFVARLTAPLLRSPATQLVKGRFCRAVDGEASGRVTMLTARPLLSLLHPQLRELHEPLSGIFAGRVDTLGALWLDCDYGVDIGILLDVVRQHGAQSVVEVDLGQLRHRNRDLNSLSITAEQVARAILARSPQSNVMHDDISVRRVPPRAGVVQQRA
jgi:glucosyl-3-phosphoglycerate synthase